MQAVRAVLAAAAVLSAAAAQRPSGQLREVATAQALGGSFDLVAIAADARRMLTFGELGDGILWDLPTGTLQRRFTAPAVRLLDVAIHPLDPWAVVRVLTKPYLFRLDFGSGRWEPIPFDEEVRAFAFDADGKRAAVLFGADDVCRLGIYPEAAMRTAQALTPDSSCVVKLPRWWPMCGRSSLRVQEATHFVQFHPRESAVLAGAVSLAWLVPLAGGGPVRAVDGVRGFLGDGEPIAARPRTSLAGMHWLRREHRVIVRDGAEPCRWVAELDWKDPVVATDGTVAVPDAHGALAVLGPTVDDVRMLRGHAGPVVQMCFDATNRWLACVSVGAVTVIDVSTRAVERLDGSLGVRPVPREPAFLFLSTRGVERVDAATRTRELVTPLPAGCEWASMLRDSCGENRRVPWWWDEDRGQLWLVEASGVRDDRLLRVRDAAFALTPRVPQYARARFIELMQGPAGSAFACHASSMHALESGNRSTVLRFDRGGVECDARTIEARIDWARCSPLGTRIAIGVEHGTVMLGWASDLDSLRVLSTRPWVNARCLEFLDESTALASDGTRLFTVDLATGRARALALPQLPGPITQLCISSDRRLVAAACADRVHVLRRR